jgi:hypothetical protein
LRRCFGYISALSGHEEDVERATPYNPQKAEAGEKPVTDRCFGKETDNRPAAVLHL